MAFGAAEWSKYYGDVGAEPPLPANINEILEAPCPFWEGKKVKETHVLVLIPKTVERKSSGLLSSKLKVEPLTLNQLGKMIVKPKQGHATKYGYYLDGLKKEHGAKPSEGAYWMLMTRDVLPGSRNKSYKDQQALVAKNTGYAVPKLLEAATCVLMEHVKTGKYLYGRDPFTYTRCQEQVAGYQGLVGGFAAGGLCLPHYFDGDDDNDSVGVGAARKFSAVGT